MNNKLQAEKVLNLYAANIEDHTKIQKVAHALSSPERIRILHYLIYNTRSLSDISQVLDIPISSVSRHIDELSDAGLIYVNFEPGPKGHTKFCTTSLLECSFSFHKTQPNAKRQKEYSVEMPVGMFSECNIEAPCGMAGAHAILDRLDDPDAFYSPIRAQAECIWFHSGFLKYHFPMEPLRHHDCKEIHFFFETCSETIYYNNKWPSDITVYINGKEVITFTSPGDFGGRRGKYTPEYWPLASTQFGLLKKITVTEEGVLLDNIFKHKNITFKDLKVYENSAVTFEIGVKKDAEHVGGINLFGRNFGDYPNSITMTVK